MELLATLLRRTVFWSPWLTFILMCSSFGLFGAGTLNIFHMFSDNWDLITKEGLMALASGTLRQLFELLLTLFLAMFFYLVFKACEHRLVYVLLHPESKDSNS